MENHQYRREEVVSIINSVIQKVEAAETVSRESLFQELQSLHKIIAELRSEISVSPGEILEKHIPSATDELDAIVGATAEATGTIMDSCEAIDSIVSSADPAMQEKVTEQITKIYEACSFQDITGQRITKVVKTLKLIDEKVDKILVAFGPHEKEKFEQAEKETTEASLLNGPQMPDQAISQDDIDKLLEQFD